MKILVSGAAGYIGSEVLHEARSRGHDVIGFDSFDSTLYPSSIKNSRAESLRQQGFEILELDALNEESVEWLPDCDVFINEMAIPGLVPSWSKIAAYMDANVNAFAMMVNKWRDSKSKPYIVQASTSSVYGEKQNGQQAALNPISPYGVSKLAAEKLLQAYSREFGFQYSILRYFSVYGKLQRPDMAYSKFIHAALRDQAITLYGDGTQKRTNTHVTDVARATVLAAENQFTDFVCDISGDETIGLSEAIDKIQSLSKKTLSINRMDGSPGDQSISQGDNSLAKEKLGWRPIVSFDEGIEEQLELTKAFLES